MRIDIKPNFSRKAKNYSYAMLFFLIFSFFTIVVIRPNLFTLISLQNEYERLRSQNTVYGSIITKIAGVQTAMENVRSDLPLLEEALPNRSQVNKIINEISSIASASGVTLKTFNIGQIDLKQEDKTGNVKDLALDLEILSDYKSAKSFIDGIQAQKRLKSVEMLDIGKEDESSSEGGSLNIKLKISAQYL